MTIHQAYLLFPKLTYEWIPFCRDLPKILIEDERLFNLFLKYPFLMDNENEIYIDFSEELYKELINWAYISEKNQITQEKLYSLIYKIANDSFKEIIAKYIPLEMNLFIIRPDIFYSIDSIQNYESLLEINDENEIENITNQQLSKAETDFVNFQFPQNTFFKDLREWRIRSLRLPKIKIVQTPPIVKVLTQFDPIIYQLIKKNPELLKTLDWRVFEEMLADILKRLNYAVFELTRASKDGGIDIIAFGKDDNFGTHKYLLQAKRYHDAVQVSPVRELLFLHDEHKATKCCLATTSTFTSGAWKLAEIHKWKLELKDQKGILNWINKVTP